MVQQGSFSLTDKETGREYKFSNASEFLEFSQQIREACEWVQKAGREQNSPRILAQKLGGHLDKLESFARQEAQARRPKTETLDLAFRQHIVGNNIPLPESPIRFL